MANDFFKTNQLATLYFYFSLELDLFFQQNRLMKKTLLTLAISTLIFCQSALVFQSDFGLKDGAVAAMKGVAFSVSPQLKIYDITHEIPAFNIWEASYRLAQTAAYWPSGTVFVSVVDPGVGTDRKSVVLRTESGHFFVSPDNGTLTLVAEQLGINSVREIDEAVNRLRNSEASYTFHGRDVYAYTGARLASGKIQFSEVGQLLTPKVKKLNYQKAVLTNKKIFGNIPILDPQYGNVWTNIDRVLFKQLKAEIGDQLTIRIRHAEALVLEIDVPYMNTFASVENCQAILYLNSLNNVALGLNQGDFAKKHCIKSGQNWQIEIEKN